MSLKKNNPRSQPDSHCHTKRDSVLTWMDARVQNIFAFECFGHGNLVSYILLYSWPQLSFSNLSALTYFLPWCLCEKEHRRVWEINLCHQFEVVSFPLMLMTTQPLFLQGGTRWGTAHQVARGSQWSCRFRSDCTCLSVHFRVINADR